MDLFYFHLLHKLINTNNMKPYFFNQNLCAKEAETVTKADNDIPDTYTILTQLGVVQTGCCAGLCEH